MSRIVPPPPAEYFDERYPPSGKSEMVLNIGGIGIRLRNLPHALRDELVTPPFSLARRGPWTLVHARRSDLLQTMLAGAFELSRLDGEWWMDL